MNRWWLLIVLLRVIFCCMMIVSLVFTGFPFIQGGNVPTADAATKATVTQVGNVWTLENDVMKSVVSFASGSIQMSSYYNKEASKEYLTGSGSQYLFYYNYGGSALISNGSDSDASNNGLSYVTPSGVQIPIYWQKRQQQRLYHSHGLYFINRPTALI